jgi:hypothetical protein
LDRICYEKFNNRLKKGMITMVCQFIKNDQNKNTYKGIRIKILRNENSDTIQNKMVQLCTGGHQEQRKETEKERL